MSASQVSHLQQMISNMQQQMALVQAMSTSLAEGKTPVAPALNNLTQPTAGNESIEAYVKSLVRSEIAASSPAPHRVTVDTNPATVAEARPELPPPPAKPTMAPPKGTFWEAIRPVLANIFTGEQQLWLSDTSNLVGLPGFLMTDVGKRSILDMLRAYQDFMRPT